MDLAAEPALRKQQLKAEAYRARAREAFAAVESATLERVRELRETAAAIWADLADAEESRLLARRARLAESAR